ncbi:MAG: hypothetical protein IT303_17165 [Dehalococcoidia bacterium]|nr:hypothetical protein [Dehalococcoidia bacterium]
MMYPITDIYVRQQLARLQAERPQRPHARRFTSLAAAVAAWHEATAARQLPQPGPAPLHPSSRPARAAR